MRHVAGERGAREAARERAVVVVDAFRASTTLALLVSKGACVILATSLEDAVSFTGVDYRIGERSSARVASFDFGNSPTEMESSELFPGATVVLSTTIIEATRDARQY